MRITIDSTLQFKVIQFRLLIDKDANNFQNTSNPRSGLISNPYKVTWLMYRGAL